MLTHTSFAKAVLFHICMVCFCLNPIDLYSQAIDSLWQIPAEDILKTPLEVASGWQDIKITTASRAEEISGKAPAMIRVVTEEQIRTRCYRSLLDVLRDLPDFKVDEGSFEQIYSVISIRGVVRQSRFIILLNGMRISSPTNEEMPIFENYPVHIAKQIEIMYGPSSALYGADAVSGVINIITKESPQKSVYEITPQIGNHGLLNTSFFTNVKLNNEAVLSISGMAHQDLQADLSKVYPDLYDMSGQKTGTFNTIFGPITPKSPVSGSFEMPLRAFNFNASLRFRDFSFQVFRNYAQVSTAVPSSPQNAVYNKDVFYGTNIFAGGITHQKNYEKVSLTSQVMASQYELNPNSSYRNTYTGMEFGYKYAVGNMIKLEEQITWRVFNNMTLTGGITHERFFSIPKTSDLPAPIDRDRAIESTYLGTAIPMKFFTVAYQNTGGFLQIQYAPSKIVSLTIGSRYDRNSRFNPTLNPRFGLVINPTPKTILKALYGSAFLAPSPEAAFEHYGSFINTGGSNYLSFFFHLPNPNLQPNYAKNLEFGARQLVGKYLSLNLNVYHTWLDNLYLKTSDAETLNLYNGKFLGYPVNFVEVTVNQGRQRNLGGTLQADFKYEFGKETSIEAYCAISYVRGRTEQKIENNFEFLQAGMLTPWQVKIGIDARYKRFSISPRFILVGKQYLTYALKDNPRERQSLAGYQILNIATRFAFYKENVFFVNLQNALNVKYFTPSMDINLENPYYLRGAPQQPIRISLGLQLKM